MACVEYTKLAKAVISSKVMNERIVSNCKAHLLLISATKL